MGYFTLRHDFPRSKIVGPCWWTQEGMECTVNWDHWLLQLVTKQLTMHSSLGDNKQCLKNKAKFEKKKMEIGGAT